jgi:hypothetical protein
MNLKCIIKKIKQTKRGKENTECGRKEKKHKHGIVQLENWSK